MLSKDILTEEQRSLSKQTASLPQSCSSDSWDGQGDKLETWGPRIWQVPVAQSEYMNTLCVQTHGVH